ncbi:MAG TPA: PilZ domain-containing protein, partial [Thermoanaerobaculia bacterium]|nr:PilZ domain-containing protein [Thermoanaerobaculia bacterium]
MKHLPPERRRVQRVNLAQPLRASIDGTRAFILDISLRGIRVLHQDDLGPLSHSCLVRTEWDGIPLELRCNIVRTALHRAADANGRSLYHSGLSIDEMVGVSGIALKQLLEHHVERALDEQKANARGVPPPLAAQSMQTGAPTAFVRHELNRGRWREVVTATSAQPEHGFTIAAQTTRAEVEMLRRAYEAASTPSERMMIRRLAALSVSSGEVV